MKREVRRSVVERGVAERTRLMDVYKQRTEDLVKQHDVVKNSLMEHKTMVCIYSYSQKYFAYTFLRKILEF